ncbi:MAG: RlmE family RNA methyltransferase [Thermoplasmata archaeon]|nr:RlmE family RNA methyltransferase [Thermoplasmata archaeon]NIU48882.1 RlmE family RNA methyltransferase [Thermoplasmata archaeon]NIY03333.1 23S rRNA (uridine(2552)-2'-O)-methyltransferase [Thermoplasmata archaeon]
MDEHRRDPYARRAKREDYRSRAAYKLLQINKKFRIMHKGDAVLDLGCAPGGWSQVAAKAVGPKGLVVGVDLEDVQPFPGLTFVRGDLASETTQAAARACLLGRRARVVLSDMSPNISGTYGLDHLRSILLARLAVDFGLPLMEEGGHLVVKTFEGEYSADLVSRLRTRFGRVKRFRPEATRKASSEVYVVAVGYDGGGPPDWLGFLGEDEVEEGDDGEDGP